MNVEIGRSHTGTLKIVCQHCRTTLRIGPLIPLLSLELARRVIGAIKPRAVFESKDENDGFFCCRKLSARHLTTRATLAAPNSDCGSRSDSRQRSG